VTEVNIFNSNSRRSLSVLMHYLSADKFSYHLVILGRRGDREAHNQQLCAWFSLPTCDICSQIPKKNLCNVFFYQTGICVRSQLVWSFRSVVTRVYLCATLLAECIHAGTLICYVIFVTILVWLSGSNLCQCINFSRWLNYRLFLFCLIFQKYWSVQCFISMKAVLNYCIL